MLKVREGTAQLLESVLHLPLAGFCLPQQLPHLLLHLTHLSHTCSHNVPKSHMAYSHIMPSSHMGYHNAKQWSLLKCNAKRKEWYTFRPLSKYPLVGCIHLRLPLPLKLLQLPLVTLLLTIKLCAEGIIHCLQFLHSHTRIKVKELCYLYLFFKGWSFMEVCNSIVHLA